MTTALLSLLNPTKGQQPYIARRGRSDGFLTGRVHVCMGCKLPSGTLLRLFPKSRTGRQFTLYTHQECSESSMIEARDFFQRQLQESVSARAEQGPVA